MPWLELDGYQSDAVTLVVANPEQLSLIIISRWEEI